MAMMFSATQVESFLLCPRKWAWSKLDGISSPPTPAAELGTIVHAQLENWLGYGIPFDCSHKSGDIAYAGLEHLPRPNTPGMTVEEAFVLELGGHTWRGLKDVQILDRQPPLVLDHKTTRDIDLFARSPEELRTNVQACLYAADAMVRTDSDTCELYWVYYQTQGPKRAKRVELVVTRADVEPTLIRACEAADAMTTIHELGIKAKDLPPNPAACADFGGCPYVSHCNLTIQEIHMSQQAQNSFLAKLNAAKAAKTTPAVNPPAQAAPEPTPAAVASPKPGVLTRQDIIELLDRCIAVLRAP